LGRIGFIILISKPTTICATTDFRYQVNNGWNHFPAYDLIPYRWMVKPGILSRRRFDNPTASVDLALSVAGISICESRGTAESNRRSVQMLFFLARRRPNGSASPTLN